VVKLNGHESSAGNREGVGGTCGNSKLGDSGGGEGRVGVGEGSGGRGRGSAKGSSDGKLRDRVVSSSSRIL
jgi:hypothetical protein